MGLNTHSFSKQFNHGERASKIAHNYYWAERFIYLEGCSSHGLGLIRRHWREHLKRQK